MSLIAGKNGILYIAGYDISGKVNKYNATPNRPLKDVTCLQDTGHKRMPVIHDDSFSFDGFYDAASGSIAEIMETLRTQTTVAIVTLGAGLAQESTVFGGNGAFQEDYSITIPVTDMMRLTGKFKVSGLLRAGYILQAKAAKTSNDNGDGVDDGAASSAGAEANLHVFACTVPDLVIKVQDDDNDSFSSPNDLMTFTTVTGQTSERKTASGSVQRYVRVTWSGTWTGDKSVTFAVGFSRL